MEKYRVEVINVFRGCVMRRIVRDRVGGGGV